MINNDNISLEKHRKHSLRFFCISKQVANRKWHNGNRADHVARTLPTKTSALGTPSFRNIMRQNRTEQAVTLSSCTNSMNTKDSKAGQSLKKERVILTAHRRQSDTGQFLLTGSHFSQYFLPLQHFANITACHTIHHHINVSNICRTQALTRVNKGLLNLYKVYTILFGCNQDLCQVPTVSLYDQEKHEFSKSTDWQHLGSHFSCRLPR